MSPGVTSHVCQSRASVLTATRKMLVPELLEYCSSQIQSRGPGAQSTSWSQQNSPRSCANWVNGSTNVHVLPASSERLANQLPVTNMPVREAAALGSPTVPVCVLVAASSRAMFSRIVTIGAGWASLSGLSSGVRRRRGRLAAALGLGDHDVVLADPGPFRAGRLARGRLPSLALGEVGGAGAAAALGPGGAGGRAATGF